jgi:hypothetical protein
VPMRITGPLLLVTVILVTSACESDRDTLKRLQFDQSLACLAATPEYARLRGPQLDSAAHRALRQETVDSLLRENQVGCDLATRKLNTFMSGR